VKIHKDNGKGKALCGAILPERKGKKHPQLTSVDGLVTCGNCKKATNGNGRPIHLLVDGKAKCGAVLGTKAHTTTKTEKVTCANCLQERKPKVVHWDDGKGAPDCGAKSGITTTDRDAVTCGNCKARTGSGEKKKEKARAAYERALDQLRNAGLLNQEDVLYRAIGLLEGAGMADLTDRLEEHLSNIKAEYVAGRLLLFATGKGNHKPTTKEEQP